VIVVKAGPLAEPADRLIGALAERGVTLYDDPSDLPAGTEPVTLAVSDGPFVFDFAGAVRELGEHRFRVLVLSRLGAHPDAGAMSLRRLWRLEEHVRGGGAPTLTLRLAPLVGPDAPLWGWLRSRPALLHAAAASWRTRCTKVTLETIVRHVGPAAWGLVRGGGRGTVSLAELRDRRRPRRGPRRDRACEPTTDEIDEHRLAECEPWASHFGITPVRLPRGRALARHERRHAAPLPDDGLRRVAARTRGRACHRAEAARKWAWRCSR
jgi:hypothetical protein